MAVLGPEKKKNMCEIIINNLLLLVISIKKGIELLLYCLRYVSFHLILNLQHKKSSKKKFMIYMEPCDTSSPTIISTQISTQMKVCFGHGCVTWFDDNHEKHNYTTK